MIIMCNCSSRGQKSNSNYFLDRLEELIQQGTASAGQASEAAQPDTNAAGQVSETAQPGTNTAGQENESVQQDTVCTQVSQEIPCERLHLNQLTDLDAFNDKLDTAQALVLSMPLYVDGIPSHVVRFMEQIYEKRAGKTSKLKVYAIGNLGFYESHQLRILLSIVKNWAEKCGFIYGGGLAVGAGEMMSSLRNVPLDKGPNAIFGHGLKTFAKHVSENTITENIHTKPCSFPRWLYIRTVNRNWPVNAKKNGVTKKEIKKRLVM